MRFNLLWAVLMLSLFTACKDSTPTRNLDALDLMKHGLPIKINAPAGAEVVADDLGFMKDVTVKGQDNYFVQIISGVATTTDPKTIIAEQKKEVQAGPFFSEIISEDANGFIFKKEVTPERINYDFRSVKIQGDQEYVFQTGLMGQFSLGEVKAMYASVK